LYTLLSLFGGGVLTFSALLMPSTADAASAGCLAISGSLPGTAFADRNISSTNTRAASFTGVFEANESIKITLNNASATTVSVTGIRNNALLSGGKNLPGGGTVDITVAILANGSTEVGVAGATDIAAADYSITSAVCTPAPSTPKEESKETTSHSVTASVARSQTTVLHQNIGARVSTIINNAKSGALGSAGTNSLPSPGDTSLNSSSTSLHRYNEPLAQDALIGTQRSDVLRRIAMQARFDSSVLSNNTNAGTLLPLEPTDQTGDSGTQERSMLGGSSPITLWGYGSYSSIDNDYNSGADDNRYDGDVWGYNLGVDYQFTSELVAGVSAGYNDTDLTTTFNNGTYQESAWVLSPYAIYQPVSNFTIIAEAGYSQGDIDVTRNNGNSRASTNSDMWYASVTTAYDYRPTNDVPFSLRPKVTFLSARKIIEGYTETDGTIVDSSKANTRQVKPAIEGAYDITLNSTILTPFVETGLVYDFLDELNNDKTAISLGAGLRVYNSATGINAAIEGSYLAGRTNYQEYTLAGTITYGINLRDLEGTPLGIVTPFFATDIDEYGKQSLTSGVGYDTGPMRSRISLVHDISQVGNAESSAQINMTLDF
jgi:hypothetical protein